MIIMDRLYDLLELFKRILYHFGLVVSEKNLEDTYYQLLFDKNYEEALKLASQYKYLDKDLVYKCRWRHSGITVQLIDDVLGRIQDKLWAISESVKTVPMSYEACRRLIEFGLQEANVKLLYVLGEDVPLNLSGYKDNVSSRSTRQFEDHRLTSLRSQIDAIRDDDLLDMIDFANLNSQQKELCRCRQNLIYYEHCLSTYEATLGDHRIVRQNFNHVFFDEFRRKTPLNFCLDFANDGDANAVEICLNFFTKDLQQHLLAILSNFPETLSPYQYRNLLPCVHENEKVFEWRSLNGSKLLKDKSDWSCRDVTIDVLRRRKEEKLLFEKEFYEKNPELKKYLTKLTGEVLTEWYLERALDMENRTLLLSRPIQLLFLGMELNIKSLKQLHDDLIEFDNIVHDCCSDKDIYLSFLDFKKRPDRTISFQLGINQKLHENQAKYQLLSAALVHCDDPKGEISTKILDNIIEMRKRDERIQLAYLQRHM